MSYSALVDLIVGKKQNKMVSISIIQGQGTTRGFWPVWWFEHSQRVQHHMLPLSCTYPGRNPNSTIFTREKLNASSSCLRSPGGPIAHTLSTAGLPYSPQRPQKRRSTTYILRLLCRGHSRFPSGCHWSALAIVATTPCPIVVLQSSS